MDDLELTPDERFILAYYTSDVGTTFHGDWIVHAMMAALFAYGLYSGQPAVLFSAFGVVILWRAYERAGQRRYLLATRSLIAKYEAMRTSRSSAAPPTD